MTDVLIFSLGSPADDSQYLPCRLQKDSGTYEPREKSKCQARPMNKILILYCVVMSDFLKNVLGVSKFEKLLPESFVEVAQVFIFWDF